MRSYDPKEGRYKDQSIGDTPKIYTIPWRASRPGWSGRLQERRLLRPAGRGRQAPRPHARSTPARRRIRSRPSRTARMLALPSCIGGLQTGCATDGKTIFTNGIDALRLASQETHGGQRRAADGRARGGPQPRHADRALAARAAQGRLARRPAAEARLHRRRRPGRLGDRRRQRRRLLHDRRQRQAGRPRRRHRRASSRRSTSARSGRAPRSPAAASTSARATRCSPRPTPRPSSPRSTPASSTPSACPARTKSIGWADSRARVRSRLRTMRVGGRTPPSTAEAVGPGPC